MLFNQTPVTLFEVSWEVCNKVGGIYSVVSSKILQTRDHFDDDYFMLGPSLQQNAGFEETSEPIWDAIRPALAAKDLKCRLGRWNIPGRPRVILVDFSKRYDSNQLLHELWKAYGVDSLSGGWDYKEPVMFASACGEVIATVHEVSVAPEHGRSVALFHEWMCGAGLLHLKREKPEIGTVFTTHATILGRSLAGSGADIYANLRSYNPANEAGVMNVTAKWSMESTSAREADAFTTVSAITGEESSVFLGTHPAVITTNGLDMRVIPDFSTAREKPLAWRAHILDAARRFLRSDLPESTRIIAISGRYEMHNKGVDVFLEALARVNRHLNGSNTHVLALCLVMGGHTGVNEQAVSGEPALAADGQNFICTHHVWDAPNDSIITSCHRLGLNNAAGDNVKVVFVPAMLDGHDGFLDMPYEEVIAACDYAFFPSWYEPWGYTPQESAAWAVPTLTTDLSGFGMWAADQIAAMDDPQEGVVVMCRRGKNYDQTAQALHEYIIQAATATEGDIAEWRKATRALAEKTDWSLFYKNYIEAFTIALTKAERRANTEGKSTKLSSIIMAASSSATPFLHPMLAVSKLPPELSRLRELVNNIWWCWHNKAKMLFRDINPQAWERHHNPFRLLEESDAGRLADLAKSEDYMNLFREVMTDYDNYMSIPQKNLSADVTPEHPIAYFSTEYGLCESVPIYSGGLGVLSGDHLKSASDLAIPLIGIGLFYKRGYFRQVLDTNGRQTAQYPENDFAHLPIHKMLDADGEDLKVKVDLPGRSLYARVWKLMVGRTPLYLLDSDISANTLEDRDITANLYVADREKRLLQEMLLGIGGVRLMRALGITPSCYHMNEGHSAFLVIERMIELMNGGMSYAEAASLVRTNTLFTTHTPVAAGNEAFSSDLMQRYFRDIASHLGLSWQQFLQLGQMEGTREHRFEMTVLALRASLWANGVSRLHGEVSRHMWNRIWKNLPIAETPIDYVTNGIHTPSYVGLQMEELLDHFLGDDWLSAEPDSPVWDKIDEIPDDIYALTRATQKEELLNLLRRSSADFAKKFGLTDKEAKSMGRLLKPDTLVIGFARRFAPYKRATLLFADPDRLERIISDPKKPVCFVFAGKSHPADEAGNDLIQRVIQLSREPRFIGRIFFIENYDLSISRMLAQGCDVWLNTPRRPYEASGTSGMKLPVNGGINLSISDGWWCEGYNRKNGWTIGPVVKLELPTDEQNDYEDAESLYTLLEHEVIPLYYDTNKSGLPARWIALSKRSFKSLTAMYSSNRMLRDYVKKAYLPAAARWARRTANDMAEMRAVTEWQRGLAARFASVKLENLAITGTEDNHMICGVPLTLTLSILLGEMRREEIAVELVVGSVGSNGTFKEKPEVLPLKGHPSSHAPGAMVYTANYTPTKNGHYSFGVRVLPTHPALLSPLETGLMLWA